MRAVIYARYSSNKQREESIEGQVRVCTEFAERKGLKIVGTYIDRAISGRTDQRPDFQKMISDSSKGIFDSVIVYKTDRFARNKYDSAIYKTLLKRNNIKLYYAAENIPDGPEGIILEALMEGMAEYYSAELSMKIKRGMTENALKCKTNGYHAPLGYRTAKDGTYEIDPDTAPFVKEIFKQFNEGVPQAEICRYLNRLGLKTATGSKFNKSSFNRLLRNKKYIGIYKFADVEIEDGVPAILTKEEFYMAQKKLRENKISKSPKAKINYLLTEKLFCGYCNEPMIGVSGTGNSGKKYGYYTCPKQRAKKGCEKKKVSKNWLENLVVEETIKYLNVPGMIDKVAEKVFAIQDEEKPDEVERLKKALEENKKSLKNIQRAIEMGVFSKETKERIDALEEEQGILEYELSEATANRIIFSKEQIAFMLRMYLEPSGDDEKDKENIIKSFISKVFLWDDKVVIYFNITKDTTDEPDPNNLDNLCSTGVSVGGPLTSSVELKVCKSGFYIIAHFSH